MKTVGRAIIAVLCATGLARADASVSLPLQGYFRPGRYMPVRIQGHGAAAPLVLTADGAIPTEYRPPENADVVVPWLIISDSPREVRWPIGADSNVPLRPLSDDERLVAYAGDESDFGRELFPGRKIVTVRLDPSRPLLRPPQAWESLDAVVLTAGAAQSVSQIQREILAAAGVAIAVRSELAPDAQWPWKQQGDYWVLRHEVAGPAGTVEPSAYGPTYGWERGWPPAFRRQILIVSAIFVLIALAAALWRSKWTIVAFVAICAVGAAVFLLWYSRRSPVLSLSGGVASVTHHVTQIDVWHWLSPVRAADANFPAEGLSHPVLPDVRHADQTRLRLICNPDGSPQAYSFRLERNQSLLFLTRLLRAEIPHPTEVASEPMKSVAENLYLSADQQIDGQFRALDPQSGEALPVVLVAPRQPR